MASNLTIDYQITGVNLYVLILNDAGAIWNGSAFVAINTANWTTYVVALTESGTSGIYQVAVPAIAAGIYGISIRVRAGTSAATTDALAGSGTLYWNGTATVLPIGAVTAGRSIALDANSRVDVGAVLGTAQTAGDLAAMITVVNGYVDTEVAAIKAKTDNLPASPAAVGSAMTLADSAITAAKFSAGAIDANAIATDALGSLELAASAAIEVADAVWASAIRTLTQSAAQVTAAVAGSAISIKRGDSISIVLTGLPSNAGYSKLWFTAKYTHSDADSAARLQVLLTSPAAGTDGLQVLNGAVATAAQGSITVNSATAITIAIDKAASKELVIASSLVYDVQMLSGGSITTLTEGTFAVTGDVTRATS